MIKMLRRFFNEKNGSASKAALYYLACQLLINGISFLTTPIFTRLISKGEYGNVCSFFAWYTMLFPLVTLNMRVTINRARYDYEEENNSFLASILIASNLITLAVLLIAELNSSYFENIFGMDITYIRVLFLYMIFQTAFDYQQIQYNIFHKYKKYVFYTILSTVFSIVLSLGLVLVMNDKFSGRVLGAVIPAVIVDIVIYASIIKRAKKLRLKYVKYAIRMAVPLIPSALSATIMSSSDRAMITHLCGSESTALYSVAYSVSSIAGILWSGLNQAWSPWLYDRFRDEEYLEVKTSARKFALLYGGLIIGIMLIAPEIVFVMGGKAYMETIMVMPPVILAMVFQFFYAFYFNTEYFYGETYIISLGTAIAAIVNLVLNYIFIPQYGYIAAAYTTLFGYAIMYVYHYLIVKIKLKKDYIFDNRFFSMIIVALSIIQVLISFCYNNSVIRWVLICAYILGLIWFCIKNKNQILGYLRKLKKQK